jgi:cysteine synthase A
VERQVHPIQGIGAGFVPDVYRTDLIDEVIQVSKDEAFEYAREIAKRRDFSRNFYRCIFSSGCQKAATLPDDAQILTFNYDTGERYLSIEGLF